MNLLGLPGVAKGTSVPTDEALLKKVLDNMEKDKSL